MRRRSWPTEISEKNGLFGPVRSEYSVVDLVVAQCRRNGHVPVPIVVGRLHCIEKPGYTA
jgi:hypothetical protein